MKVTRPHLWLVNTVSINGLVPSGNKPLPEPILTQIYVAIWRHQATGNASSTRLRCVLFWCRHTLDLRDTFAHILQGCSHWTSVYWDPNGLDMINSSPPSAARMHKWTGSALVQVMAYCRFGAKSLREPVKIYCQFDPWEQTSVKFQSKYKIFIDKNALKNAVCEMVILFRERWVKNNPDVATVKQNKHKL